MKREILSAIVASSQWAFVVDRYLKQFLMAGIGLVGFLFTVWSMQGMTGLNPEVYGSAAKLPAVLWGLWAFSSAVVYFFGWFRESPFVMTPAIGSMLIYMATICYLSASAPEGHPIAAWTFIFSCLMIPWFWGSVGICADVLLRKQGDGLWRN